MRQKRLTPQEVADICDRAETATHEEVKTAYGVLMINAPCWAFTDDEQQQRDYLRECAEGPQE